MAKRIVILLAILLLRVAIGGIATAGCLNGQQIRVAGIISEIEQTSTIQIIRIGYFSAENSGKMRYFRGQRVAIVGRCQRQVIDFLLNRIRLIEPKIEASGEKVFAKSGWLMRGVNLQEELVEIYQRQLPEPEASLVAGIVLGAKAGLPQKFYDALIDTGTVHMVVASGYNLTVIAEVLFYILIYFVSRKWATVGVIGGMLVYAWMTGWGAPVMRALVMASLILVSKVRGRAEEVGWWLCVAVWVMLMWSPEMIIDTSFQLSVAATAGLVFLEPWLRKIITRMHTTSALHASPPKGSEKEGVLKFISESELIPTLSAQIVTAPIIWWHFGRLSLISPLVNLLVLPLVPPVMLLGALQLVFGWIIAPFSYALLHLIVVIVNIFG